MVEKKVNKLKFGNKANYQIIVQGKLNKEWSSSFADLKVESKQDQNGDYTSIIHGSVKDQSELSGILNSLYSMHLPVIEVKFIKSKQGS